MVARQVVIYRHHPAEHFSRRPDMSLGNTNLALPSRGLSVPAQAATASYLPTPLSSNIPPAGQAAPSGSVPTRIPISCPVCGRVFRRPSERNRHISDSHLPPCIACTLCPWTGSRACSLKAHSTRCHSGNREPFTSHLIYSQRPYIKRIIDAGKVGDNVAKKQIFSSVKYEAELEAAATAIYLWGFYPR
ncbi:hypothetical protein BC834DRAFT_237740 [Gloeopeniophorella convolvens]|nr:hypothetical protein BC834DRAFT_237740 [Gloeopeniophorella convolvens]